MSVTIHMGSMLFGFFLGYVAIATIFLCIGYFDKRWDIGFSQGYTAGYKIRKSEEEKEVTDEDAG